MDKNEFKTVMNGVFDIMSTDPDMGPKLRKARVPQRFIFPDVKLVLNATYADEGQAEEGHNLRWVWGDKGCDWEPEVEMMMDSDVAVRYFQGKVNVPIAMARGQIKSKGSVTKALKLVPITKPVFRLFREWLEDNGFEHLVV